MKMFVILCLLLVAKETSCFLTQSTRPTVYRLLSLQGTDEPSNLKSYLDILSNSFTNEVFESLSIYSKNQPALTSDTPTLKYGINLNKLQSVSCRLVELKGIKKCQFNYKYATNDQVKNYDIPDEATSVLSDILETGSQMMRKVVLTSTSDIVELQVSASGNYKIKTTKNEVKSMKLKSLPVSDTDNASTLFSHDRAKNLFVPTDSAFLRHLKIVADDGVTIKPGMSDKFKQIQKFVEIMDGLVKAASGAESAPLCVVDMGSGLGYLTFATHSHFSRTRPSVATVGVEIRPELVAQTSGIANDLGAPFDKLHFIAGSIQSVDAPQLFTAAAPETVKVLIALHACDTATDDAIMQGLRAQADVIVVAPCCQKEVRPQIDRKFKRKPAASGSARPELDVSGKTPEERVALQSLMQAGIHRERMTEIATDQLRALILEHEGYDARISEFVDRSHTAKNVLISAVRRPRTTDQSSEAKKAIKQEIEAIMKSFGITKHSLYSKIFN